MKGEEEDEQNKHDTKFNWQSRGHTHKGKERVRAIKCEIVWLIKWLIKQISLRILNYYTWCCCVIFVAGLHSIPFFFGSQYIVWTPLYMTSKTVRLLSVKCPWKTLFMYENIQRDEEKRKNYTCETRKRTQQQQQHQPPNKKIVVCNRRPQNRNWEKKDTSKIHVGWSDRCRWVLRKRSNDDEKYIAHMKCETEMVSERDRQRARVRTQGNRKKSHLKIISLHCSNERKRKIEWYPIRVCVLFWRKNHARISSVLLCLTHFPSLFYTHATIPIDLNVTDKRLFILHPNGHLLYLNAINRSHLDSISIISLLYGHLWKEL